MAGPATFRPRHGDPVPYPLSALPDEIRPAVEEIHAFIQCPPSLVACSALSFLLSLAGQGLVDVRRDRGLSGPTSLFFLTLAESGERKSACDKFFSEPVATWVEGQIQENEPEIVRPRRPARRAWEAKRNGVAEAIKQASKQGKSTRAFETTLREIEREEPPAPRVPDLVLVDETAASLAHKFKFGWPSRGLITAEGGLFFGSHGMRSDAVMGTTALLNSCWDGATFSVGRKSTDSFRLEQTRLTLGIQVQKSPLQKFIENDGHIARGNGFLARFLLSWPETTRGYRLYKEPPATWRHFDAYAACITRLLGTPMNIDEKWRINPKMIALGPAAREWWIEFYNNVEILLREGEELESITDVASKAAEQAARLAALFHLARHGVEGEIDVGTIERAGAIVSWHLSEARRFYHAIGTSPELSDAIRLDNFLLRHCRTKEITELPKSEVMKFGPAALREKKRIDPALSELVQLGRLRLIPVSGKMVIQVNPKLLG